MNLIKSLELFNPNECKEVINIIGCGATGSTIAELLARFGLRNIKLWDFDTVESKNVANQVYTERDFGMKKVDALKRIMCDINSDAEKYIKTYPNGWNGERLEGYVFLCVDNIEVHKAIVEKNYYNNDIVAIFDQRCTLYEGQSFAALWHDVKQKENLKRSQDFTHEEAQASEVRSGCNEVLSVAPTFRVLVNMVVCNLINYIKTGNFRKMIVVHPFDYEVAAM